MCECLHCIIRKFVIVSHGHRSFRDKLKSWIAGTEVVHIYYYIFISSFHLAHQMWSCCCCLFLAAPSWPVPFSPATAHWMQGETWHSEVHPLPGQRLISQVLCLDNLNQISQTDRLMVNTSNETSDDSWRLDCHFHFLSFLHSCLLHK